MIDVNVKLLFPPSTFSSTSSSSSSPTRTMPSSDASLPERDASGYSAYQERSTTKRLYGTTYCSMTANHFILEGAVKNDPLFRQKICSFATVNTGLKFIQLSTFPHVIIKMRWNCCVEPTWSNESQRVKTVRDQGPADDRPTDGPTERIWYVCTINTVLDLERPMLDFSANFRLTFG